MTNVNGNGKIKFSMLITDTFGHVHFRLRTFDTYPKQKLPDKFQLARAGLYYTGKLDICQCFRCNVKLSSWERDDNVIKEHFKWSSNCEYMKMVVAPPPRQPGFMLGSSVSSFGGSWRRGSSNMMNSVDPKVFNPGEITEMMSCEQNREEMKDKGVRRKGGGLRGGGGGEEGRRGRREDVEKED